MSKKIISFMLTLLILIMFTLKISANVENYEAYNEIMMSEGKLLIYFTDEELEKYMKEVKKRKFWGINIFVVNKNIETTYISSTIYNVDNRGNSDIKYELDVAVEKNVKTNFSISGNVSASGKGVLKGFKTDLEAKAGVDYSNSTTESRKETQKLDLIIEKNSRAIVYLMGSARVTNGVCACYICFVNTVSCGFEYFTIVNQYPRLEKRLL